jgi:toxin ParE1/3/4
MSSNKQPQYRLSPQALDDLEEVWRYTAEQWSIAQAERYVDELVQTFSHIAAMPLLARERKEITPPVRIHINGNHLIVYRIESDHIAIIRILGGRQNWQAILTMLDS